MHHSGVNPWQTLLQHSLAFTAILGFQTVQSDAEDNAAPHPFSVHLTDTFGKPVDGAELGLMASIGGNVPESVTKEKTEWRYNMHVRSDTKGNARFGDSTGLERFCVVARHESRRIAAVASVDPAKIGDEPIQLTLVPETQIVGRATCKHLTDLKRELGGIVVLVRCNDKFVLECVFDEPTYGIPLPAGDYEIEVYRTYKERQRQQIAVKAQPDPQQIDPIDLQASKLELLEGHNAPDFAGVTAWKNSDPISLADLHGKCVLLDFWGWWCGPCVERMPELFKVHEKYHDHGLVIVGIHVDTATELKDQVDSAEKLDKRLVTIRKELWDGRDVPFPVALIVQGTPTRDGAPTPRDGEMVATYGLSGYPTQVLIDRNGNVVGQFWPNEKGIALLEKVLRDE